MDLTLETVRSTLRGALGPGSFVAGFVRAIHADPGVRTACINAEGVVLYNPDFVRLNVRTEVDLFCLVFHELLHPAFGHFIHPSDDAANIACDAIINAIVTHVFAEPSGRGSLFVRVYPERGLSALLRPRSALQHSRYGALYRDLYPQAHGGRKLSAGEIIQSLRALLPPGERTVLLLDSHGVGGEGKPAGDALPTDVAARIADELRQAAIRPGQGAGNSPHLQDLLIEVLAQKKRVREELLARYATRRTLGRFFAESRRPRRITSPFPLHASRRDIALLSAGVWPGLFRNRQVQRMPERKGVAVFLDVSGSVNEHLPAIIGLLAPYRERIASVHLFSNTVVEIDFVSLAQGRVQTTYGTDFDCVARAIVERGYDRAVVLTDGHASLGEDARAPLEAVAPHILTILFGGKPDCPDLKPFGEVVQLTDVVE